MIKFLAPLIFLFLLNSCATIPPEKSVANLLAYAVNDQGTDFSRFAPVFAVESPEKGYNRIGTPRAYAEGEDISVFVDPDRPAVYFEKRTFATKRARYVNLIYRVHFSETPDDLFPFQLGAGKNVGLLVIVTLNSSGLPVLYTTVHTCGCYLAFFPTNFLSGQSLPENWPGQTQKIYGETLSSFLDLPGTGFEGNKLLVILRDGSHRVADVAVKTVETLRDFEILPAELHPVESLERLPLVGEGEVSFFEQEGEQAGYVRNNSKIRERILMSWWTLDWRIGEDKKLGRDREDPPIFYTSLKPWARKASDLRNFPAFLAYWGWRL